MNTTYFDQALTQLDKVESYLTDFQNYMDQALAVQTLSCEQLAIYFTQSLGKCSQATANIAQVGSDIADQIAAMKAAINVEIGKIAPLIVAPTNLTGCISWITNAANYFNGANVNLGLQLTELTTKGAAVANKVQDIDAKINAIQDHISQAIQRQQILQGCS